MHEPLESNAEPLTRCSTGVSGLDAILGGGLFSGSIYIVAGSPGAGKTILGNQICAHHVGHGGSALYVTLLAETHGRMLTYLRSLSFFNDSAVGTSLKYLNGFTTMETEGLAGLLRLLRNAVRAQKATLLVLDGLLTASLVAPSEIDYRKFIHELQTWVGVLGCTVLFLTSSRVDDDSRAEHTMVDGIIQLDVRVAGLRALRELRVTKFRGSAFIQGFHPYSIASDGFSVFPRVEASLVASAPQRAASSRIRCGCPRLDELVGGGLRRGSTTLLVGSSGAGKTVLGLQFLAAGVSEGESGLHFGFYETPADLIAKGNRFGWNFDDAIARNLLSTVWQPASEHILDELAYKLLAAVRERRAKRLVIDGLVGFKEAAYKERLSALFALVADELGALGVTTLITEETRELFVRRIEIPTSGVSAVFHNIIFLRQVEKESELLRLLTVMKTRDSAHDRGLYQIDITDQGLKVGERFMSSEAILTGISETRWTQSAEGEQSGTGAGNQ
jgi:circadian clock protein KaiC